MAHSQVMVRRYSDAESNDSSTRADYFLPNFCGIEKCFCPNLWLGEHQCGDEIPIHFTDDSPCTAHDENLTTTTVSEKKDDESSPENIPPDHSPDLFHTIPLSPIKASATKPLQVLGERVSNRVVPKKTSDCVTSMNDETVRVLHRRGEALTNVAKESECFAENASEYEILAQRLKERNKLRVQKNFWNIFQ